MAVSLGPLISQYCVLSDSYLAGIPAGLQLHQLATWLPHSLHNHNNCLLQSLLLACLELGTESTSITFAKMHVACETLAETFGPTLRAVLCSFATANCLVIQWWAEVCMVQVLLQQMAAIFWCHQCISARSVQQSVTQYITCLVSMHALYTLHWFLI